MESSSKKYNSSGVNILNRMSCAVWESTCSINVLIPPAIMGKKPSSSSPNLINLDAVSPSKPGNEPMLLAMLSFVAATMLLVDIARGLRINHHAGFHLELGADGAVAVGVCSLGNDAIALVESRRPFTT